MESFSSLVETFLSVIKSIINNNILIGMTISRAGDSFFESFNLNADNNIIQVSRESIEDIENAFETFFLGPAN